MTAAAIEGQAPAPARPRNRFVGLIRAAVRYLVLVLLCLTPATAILALGWLTRKTAGDCSARLAGNRPPPWPNFVLAEVRKDRTWWAILFGGLIANFKSGLKAWISILILTLPFSLVWLAGWFAGWENSFNKGYEQSGVWPVISLLAVILSTPFLSLVAMALAHQAVNGTIASAVQLGRILSLVRSAGWPYILLTLLFAIGAFGVFAARSLPTFAEQFSPDVASGDPAAIQAFARRFEFAMTAILVAGVLVIRHALARIYASAERRRLEQKRASRIKTFVMFLLTSLLWLGAVFSIYVTQFVNYAWWSWVNQPTYMLPWLGLPM